MKCPKENFILKLVFACFHEMETERANISLNQDKENLITNWFVRIQNSRFFAHVDSIKHFIFFTEVII